MVVGSYAMVVMCRVSWTHSPMRRQSYEWAIVASLKFCLLDRPDVVERIVQTSLHHIVVQYVYVDLFVVAWTTVQIGNRKLDRG